MSWNIGTNVKELSSERTYDTTNRYVSNRLSLWCPVCGAAEGKGCVPAGGLVFASHDNYARGIVPKPVIIPEAWETPTNKVSTRPRWTPKGWLQ